MNRILPGPVRIVAPDDSPVMRTDEPVREDDVREVTPPMCREIGLRLRQGCTVIEDLIRAGQPTALTD